MCWDASVGKYEYGMLRVLGMGRWSLGTFSFKFLSPRKCL